jgi:hypothetical protein
LVDQRKTGSPNSKFCCLRCPFLHTHNVPENGRSAQVSPLGFQIPSKNWANKPPDEQRYDDDEDDKSTVQLTMTISDSNAVTTINNEQEITLRMLWLREFLFSIEMQDLINGFKSKLLAASAKAFNHSYFLAKYEAGCLVYSIATMFYFACCRPCPAVIVAGNDDRMDTAVGIVYCVEGIFLVRINYTERKFLSWIGRFSSGMSLGRIVTTVLPGVTVQAALPFMTDCTSTFRTSVPVRNQSGPHIQSEPHITSFQVLLLKKTLEPLRPTRSMC